MIKNWFKRNFYISRYFNKNISNPYFLKSLLVWFILVIVFVFLIREYQSLNNVNLWIFKFGSILLLVNIYFLYVKSVKLYKNHVKSIWNSLGHGYHIIFFIVIILVLGFFMFREPITGDSISEKINEISLKPLIPVKIDNLDVSTALDSVSPSLSDSCRSKVIDEADAEITRSRGDFSHRIIRTDTLNTQGEVRAFADKYQSTNIYDQEVCVESEFYKVYLVEFYNTGYNPNYVDKYSKMFVCDENDNLLEVKYSCRW